MLACTNVAAASFADTAGGDPVTIPSHTVVADRLYTFAVMSSTTPVVVSVTLPGTGTEVLLAERTRGAVFSITAGYMLCTAGGTGTGSIDFDGATTGVGFVLDEWTGIDLADPVIDANLVEFDGTDATPPSDISAALPNALAKATNAIWGSICGQAGVGEWTPGADYTLTADLDHATPSRGIMAQYDIEPPDLTFDAQASVAIQWAGIAFEINEADEEAAAAFYLPARRRGN